MLLTLTTRSLRPLFDRGDLTLLDAPQFVVTKLRLRGLNVAAEELAGWSLEELDRLRDRADKAACPCLVLLQEEPLKLAHRTSKGREQARARIAALATGASRLGCNSLAIRCHANDDEEQFEITAEGLRDCMGVVERYELNLLLAPYEGLTHEPERMTELIKRVGGFRIGSFPSFAHAAETKDAVETLRMLAPYAGAMEATVEGFSTRGKHKGLDLEKAVEAIRSVGFDNTLAIDYRGDEPEKDIERAREILAEAIETADAS